MDISMIGPIMMILVVIVAASGMFIVIGGEVLEAKTIQSLDKGCYQLEKIRYCQIIGMELGSIVVTPGGIFGGSPYNKEACVSEHSEKIINYKDTNYEKCLPS